MDLSITRGDSKTYAFTLKVDLTGSSVWMTAKQAYTDTDEAAVFQKTDADGITVLDDTIGLIQVDLDPADTEDLDGTRHRLVYDIQVQDATFKVTTVLSGRLTVYPDVTITTNES